jgi:hypothetical protein
VTPTHGSSLIPPSVGPFLFILTPNQIRPDIGTDGGHRLGERNGALLLQRRWQQVGEGQFYYGLAQLIDNDKGFRDLRLTIFDSVPKQLPRPGKGLLSCAGYIGQINPLVIGDQLSIRFHVEIESQTGLQTGRLTEMIVVRSREAGASTSPLFAFLLKSKIRPFGSGNGEPRPSMVWGQPSLIEQGQLEVAGTGAVGYFPLC